MNKILGVLGGMGPLATVDFLQKLIEETPARRDQDHVPVVAYSVPQMPDRPPAIIGTGESPLPHNGGIAMPPGPQWRCRLLPAPGVAGHPLTAAQRQHALALLQQLRPAGITLAPPVPHPAGLCCHAAADADGRVPAYALSLGVNPQSQRIGWATWFPLFGDAVVINRPLAFLTIAFLVLAYRVKHVADGMGAWQVVALVTAALTAWFQAAYAHTFGMAMLMFPALMLLVAEAEDRWRAAGVWLASILLLVGWGTGEVGDMAGIFGKVLFSPERVHHIVALGVNYPSLLATLEAAAYIAFGVMLMLRLLGGAETADAGRYIDR